jgi:hypothetical protein
MVQGKGIIGGSTAGGSDTSLARNKLRRGALPLFEQSVQIGGQVRAPIAVAYK